MTVKHVLIQCNNLTWARSQYLTSSYLGSVGFSLQSLLGPNRNVDEIINFLSNVGLLNHV